MAFSAAEYRARTQKTHRLPGSGMDAILRRPGPAAGIQAARLPKLLLGAATILAKSDSPQTAGLALLAEFSDAEAAAFDKFAQQYVCAAFVNPRVVMGNASGEELGVTELDVLDFWFVFNFAVRGELVPVGDQEVSADALERFRAE